MADGKKGRERTKRAEILLDVLDCINRDAYEAFEKYWIFGGSLDDLRADAEHPGRGEENNDLRQVNALGEALGEMSAEITARMGRRSAMRRTSLDPPTEGKRTLKRLDRLEQLGMGGMANELQRLVDTPYTPLATADQDSEWDSLDANYAKEVLDRLSQMVHRVTALETLDIRGIPNDRTRQYFEEAHRCYIYGFPVACTVLCRAIIESALQEAVDLRLSLQTPKTVAPANADGGTDKLRRLIGQAKELRLLTNWGRVCADDVRRAGNRAIHSEPLEKFNRSSETEKLGEVLTKTRTVLRELYGQIETR